MEFPIFLSLLDVAISATKRTHSEINPAAIKHLHVRREEL